MPELHTTKPEPKRHDFAAGETGRGPSVPSNGLANDPKAGQWDGRRMSKRMIADYKTFIVTDGEGVRNSLYVSGCPFHCVDCFNASIWDFSGAHEFFPCVAGPRPDIFGMTEFLADTLCERHQHGSVEEWLAAKERNASKRALPEVGIKRNTWLTSPLTRA